MKERLTEIFPFALAVVMPPAGLIIGLLQMTQEDRDLGVRIVGAAIVGAVIWLLVLMR